VKALREGRLEHRFEDAWTISKYDEWPFYVDHFQSQCGTNKGVDFVARDPADALWLIELKDYRVHSRAKSIELAEEVAIKVRDSLAGIIAAAKWHSDHAHLEEAKEHLKAKKLRVVLHLEQAALHSPLSPRKFALANVQQKLKQLVRAVDAHPVVMELATMGGVSWTAVSI
jgi:hypothetical protein